MDLVEVKHRSPGLMRRHPWELARFEVIRDILKQTYKNEENFTVLDIGCGDAFFVTTLSDLYPKATFYAIDIAFTEEIVAQIKKEIGSRSILLLQSLEEAGRQMKKKADLVLLLDVIEHIEDDKAFLNELYNNQAIGPDTRIMITVPAFESLFCSHDHFLGHYRRYTNKSLHNTLKGCGFEKIKLGYFFTVLIPPRLIQVLKEKIFKPDLNKQTTGLVEWNKGMIISGVIKWMLMFDYKVFKTIRLLTGFNMPGLSNYILCKKPAS
jgi:trans-aconitate methyltransferase